MNALFLSTKVPYPAKDGGALGTVTFIEQLRALGYQVTTIAANTPKHFISSDESQKSDINLVSVPVNTSINFFALIRNLCFSKLPYLITRFHSKRFKRKLLELLQSQQFNVIQLEGSQMGIYLPFIRACTKAPVILRAHNIEHKIWEEISATSKSFLKGLYLNIQAKRYKTYEKDLYQDVDYILPVSCTDESFIRKFASVNNLQTISFAVDVHSIHNEINSLNSVYFIGALDWVPNQQGLIWFLEEIWPEASKKIPELSLHIAGRNAPEWLKERFSTQNIFFYGEVDNALAFSSRFKVMIAPVLSGSGIRIKIIEAMAMKKAVVTTAKGAEGLEDLQNELVIADDVNDFCKGLIELLADEELQKSIGEEAYRYVLRNFSKAVYKNKIENCYKQVILG